VSGDTPAPEASEQSVNGLPARGESEPVPATLSELLLADKVSARRFVHLLSKRPALADDDLARSHDILKAQPSKMVRVIELARVAAEAVPQPGLLLRWCEQVVRSQDDALREWALDPGQDAAAAFAELLSWAYPIIRRKSDRSKRQLAEYCVVAGLIVLAARRALGPLDALRALASAGGARREGYRSTSLERATIKQLKRAGMKQLFDLARIVALCETEIVAAEDARGAAVGLVGDLRRENQALEEARDVLSAKVRDIGQELDRRDREIAEIAAELEGARTRATQDQSTLKARFRREIGDGLAGLLADAWDAIDTDPPHPDVAKERLEIAREAIRREMEWLNKSSG